VTDATEGERRELIRQLRQRYESLARAGLDRVPRPPELERPAPLPRPAAAPTRVDPPPVAEAPPPSPPSPPSPRPKAPPPILTPASSLFGEPALPEAPVPADERPARLAALAAEVAACTKCPLLATTRTQTVFGEGSPTARLMFIGEAPGAVEDRTGRPFVGPAGQLLTDMITKGMGLAREQVYIANILKSRPPGNRDPLPEESANCLPFLERQIAIVRPEFLCLLGRIAASILLETALPAGRLRGKWHSYRGIPTIVTWHPSYLLRNAAAKKEAWEDLQMLMKAMGITPPGRKKG
jgi:uracil-DNA glycosylase